jgi:16S rRNA (guanine527-N7)-methyltransferase
MDLARIAELLQPFLSPLVDDSRSERSEESAVPSSTQLTHISTYIDILIHWNTRMNLTAVRQPEEIVTRHFGESIFAARHLFPNVDVAEVPVPAAADPAQGTRESAIHVVDLGSGAGFPGLPIKIWAPSVRLTLIESNQRKAVFLREVSRALTLTHVNIFAGRAEDFPAAQADVVTLRAVERFDAVLPLAVRLAKNQGRLALLIGQAQLALVCKLTPKVQWSPPVEVPLSVNRILLLGTSRI